MPGTLAARQLEQSHAALSQHIARLEELFLVPI